jgi:hypothetical protein
VGRQVAKECGQNRSKPERSQWALSRDKWPIFRRIVTIPHFGLNVKADPGSDQNSITEKWEGLALIPLRDPRAPDDFLLLVGNDNDFKAA